MSRKNREAKLDAQLQRETMKRLRWSEKKLDQAHADGWTNMLTGLGFASLDKRMHSHVRVDKLEYADCEALYRGSDMAARIVDSVPDEMTREGWAMQCENDPKTAEAMDDLMEELEVEDRVNQALKWARAFRGAGVIIGADDGSVDIAQPLRMDRIRKVEWLSVLDARELVPWTFYLDPMSPHYGMPASYKIMPYNVGIGPGGVAVEEKKLPLFAGNWQEIHATRILRFQGVVVNRYQMRETWGWGSSIFDRAIDALRDFDSAFSSGAALVQDFAQAVYSIQGLAEAMASGNDKLVQQRLGLFQLQRSVLRGVLVDAGDKDGAGKEGFERKPTPISGLPDLLDRIAHRLAASVDMPVTRLFGQQPAGLNATGDNDIRRWYDHVRALQKRLVKPQLRYLCKVLFAAKEGPTGGKVPEKWSITFRPLWQLDDLQESQRRLNIANADNLYINNQTLMPEEVADTRFGGDTYNGNDMNLDTAVRKKMAAEAPEEEPEGHEPEGPAKSNPRDVKPNTNRQPAGLGGPSTNANPVGSPPRVGKPREPAKPK